MGVSLNEFSVVHNEIHELKSARDEVERIELKAENHDLSSQEKETRLGLLKKIEDIQRIKVLDLKQKAKVKWAV